MTAPDIFLSSNREDAAGAQYGLEILDNQG